MTGVAPPAGPFQGYIDERSTRHVAGWMRDLSDPAVRLDYEVVVEGPDERVVHRGRADQASALLVKVGVGDGGYAFFAALEPPLPPAERDRVFVRPAGAAHRLELAPEMKTEFTPISHLAMDIVNNCNLRCPFCVYDYSGVRATRFMTDETYEAALRLIPFVTDGNFWLSCLHEATLHPRLIEFVERVPSEYRRKVFYTTNLAKRMPPAYFEHLAGSGIHHVNISLESLDPAIYERMRAGARHPIFMANWAMLLDRFATADAPPPLRYNIMAYRSNLAEIPGLVDVLLRDKRAWQVEVRHTFDVAHIPPGFREREFLSTEEWAGLAQALAGHPPDRVSVILPPDGAGYDRKAEADPGVAAPPEAAPATPEAHNPWARSPGSQIPRPLNLQMDCDGSMMVYGDDSIEGGAPLRTNYVYTNIAYVKDPIRFLMSL